MIKICYHLKRAQNHHKMKVDFSDVDQLINVVIGKIGEIYETKIS